MKTLSPSERAKKLDDVFVRFDGGRASLKDVQAAMRASERVHIREEVSRAIVSIAEVLELMLERLFTDSTRRK